MSGAEARLPWLVATVADLRVETPTAKTIVFDVPGWTGHLAGQHVDLRFTAEDGYSAQRSYSIASAAGQGARIEITVQRVTDGEVSPFLLEELRVGDLLELRGPIGGYFTWTPSSDLPLLLVGGGSGVVPLMSMLRSRRTAPRRGQATLLYSSRTYEQILYAGELAALTRSPDAATIVHTLTREIPPGWEGARGRVDRAMLTRHGIDVAASPQVFVCGPTAFVESVADHLLAIGHAEARIRTERFGPTGEAR